jgi:hypothetical protein
MKYTKTVRASRNLRTAPRAIRASRRRIRAGEDIEDVEVDAPVEDASVEESELLFEAEDVAELIAEITEQPVDVTTDTDTDEVVFTVGEDEYTITPEGDEEVVEESRKIRSARKVSASRRAARRVSASRRLRR